MHQVYLLLGSNEGNCVRQINRAVREIKLQVGNVIKKSSLYETEAWGFESKNLFFNQVILVETDYLPEEVLDKILKIENILGRIRNHKGYASRTIDIDILFYNHSIINTNTLKIPHPMINSRRFTLEPLNEIAADYRHPVNQITVAEILKQCDDKLKVIKFNKSDQLN